jgi:hypothetical protein
MGVSLTYAQRSTSYLRAAGVWAMRKKISQWFKRRFQIFDLLPQYFTAAASQMQNILWGALLPFLAWGIWFIVSTPPTWVNLTAIGTALFIAGYYVWRADHVRLQQKIEVTRVRTFSWPRRDGGVEGTQYYFEIVNKSEALTIHGVRVQLQEIVPEIKNSNWFPIPLHLQHDNPVSGVLTQSFELHPSEPKNIDLFTTVTGSNVAHIAHTVSGADLRVPVTGRCRLRVMVNAEDVPVLFVWFAVWMDDGALRCEIE